MRTETEIIDRIKKIQADDFFGVRIGELMVMLSFATAKPFLKPESKEEDWKHEDTNKSIAERVKSYMDFAWEKANRRRGLSASRSIEHFREMLWLDSYNDFDDKLDHLYKFYGKTCLVLIAEMYSFDWKKLDDGKWGNNEGSDIPDTFRDNHIKTSVDEAARILQEKNKTAASTT